MTMLQTPVSFGGYTGTAYRHDHRWWVAPRPIAEFLGLSWARQYRAIVASDVLSVVALRATAADGKSYQTTMLQTGDLGIWLAGISARNVAQEARPMLIEMQRRMRDAIEAQINEAFGLPALGDFEDLVNAPVRDGLVPGLVVEERAAILAEPGVLRAALLFRMGLPGTKVAVLSRRSTYWARKQRRFLETFGMVEPRRPTPPANDPGQPDLFVALPAPGGSE